MAYLLETDICVYFNYDTVDSSSNVWVRYRHSASSQNKGGAFLLSMEHQIFGSRRGYHCEPICELPDKE